MSKDGATDNSLVTGRMIFEYLDKFTDENGLKKHIRFDNLVSKIERCPTGWRLATNGTTVQCSKLIIATGVTSIKKPPSFEVKNDSIPVLHSLDIAQNAANFSNDEAYEFVVVGAAKSAYDLVYHLCTIGKKVTW